MRMMRPCIVKEELLGNTITSPFALDSLVYMRRFVPDRMKQCALNRLNTRIFLKECHSQDTARIGINENGEPETTDYTTRCFVHNKDIKQVVICKDILQWESSPMSKRVKDHIDTLPRAFPIAIVHHLPSLIGLRLEPTQILVKEPTRRHSDFPQKFLLIRIFTDGLYRQSFIKNQA